MRDVSTKAVGQSPPAAGWVAVAGATALWTALVIVAHARSDDLSSSSRAAVIYGIPSLLAAAMIFDSRIAANRALQFAAGWAGLVVAASLAVDRLSVGSTAILLAIPACAIAAVVFGRRPAMAVLLAFVMSGFFGSLIAFWKFPNEKTVQLVFAALALTMLWKALVIGRDYSIRMTLGFGLALLFGYLSIVQLVLDYDAVASRGFMASTWFMLALPLIALAGWSRDVHEKIAKGVVVVAGLVGAYAVYRWAVGISVTEYLHWGADRYNYVGGELRVIGSFPTGQDLGGWTACAVPFCLASAFVFKGRWRVVSLVSATLCLVALAGSQLRMAVVAVAVGVLVVVVLHEASRGFAGRRLGATVTALVVMVGIGIAAFQITGGTTDDVTHSYTSLLRPFDRSDPSVDARFYKWENAFRDLRGHPFGYGIGTANKQSTAQLASFESVGQFDVDNGFLVVALEQGLAVMVLFALALAVLAVDLIRNGLRLTERFPAGIAIGAAGTLVAFLVLEWAVAFQDGPRALAIWIIAGLGLAQFTTLRSAGTEE